MRIEQKISCGFFLVAAFNTGILCHSLFAAPQYRRSVTCAAPSSTLTDFPVLVKLNNATFRTVAYGGHVSNANAYDVLVRSDTACSSAMYWETDSFDGSSGVANIWTKISSYSSSGSTVFYICYGDSSIGTFQSTASSVWNSAYKAVWHLRDGSSLSGNDSTTAGINPTSTTATATTGKIDGGAALTGSQKIDYGAGPSSLHLTTLTIESWAKTSDNGLNTIYGNQVVGYYSGFWMYFYYGAIGYGQASNSAGANTGFTLGSGYNNGNWHHIVATFNGSSKVAEIFVDGASLGTYTYTYVPEYPDNLRHTGIGRLIDADAFVLNGSVDEVRVSNTVRGSAWIAKSYTNQNAPETDCAIGAEVALTGSRRISIILASAWPPEIAVDLPRRRAIVCEL